jgi:hypothetical protein
MADNSMENRQLAIREDLESGGLAEQFAPTGLSVYASFDTRTRDGATKLLMATMGKCEPLRDHIGETIIIEHFYAHEVESPDPKTGELSKWIRTVLFTPEGKAYACGAMGVRKSIAVVSQIRGVGHFNPPIAFVVRQQMTGNKRQWLFIQPDVDALLAGVNV